MISRPIIVVVGIFISLAMTVPVIAQQRPLVTQDPESVGEGLVLVEVGVDYLRDKHFPASGLRGNLIRAPKLGLSIGVSSIAEVQVGGISYSRLNIIGQENASLSSLLNINGDMTSDMDDIIVGAKVRLFGEAGVRPAVGVRFVTRLPNARSETGLGSDTMSFFNSLLIGKTISLSRIVGNIGFGILDDPLISNRQDKVLIYGLSVASKISQRAELVAEVNGRFNNKWTESTLGMSGESSAFINLGTRYTRGLIRVDGSVLFGLTPRDANIGLSAGLTLIFRGLNVP